MGATTSTSASLPEAGTDLSAGNADGDSSLDEILLGDFSETFIYKIPPRTSAEGYCADQWGLDRPALTCRLRVTAWATTICIVIWRRADTESTQSLSSSTSTAAILRRAPLTASPVLSGWLVVANARWEVDNKSTLSFWLEPVLDSSRYFALRCMPPPMKSSDSATSNNARASHVILGIGFRERDSAFSLKAAISDHSRSCERQATAGTITSSQIAVTDDNNGSTMHLTAQKNKEPQQQRRLTFQLTAPSDQIRLLRPPPPPPPPQPLPSSIALTSNANEIVDDDDFGDFNTAATGC